MFSNKEKDINIDINKPPKGESYEKVVKHVKRSALVGLLAGVVVVLIAVWSVVAPYAISINGSTVCFVKNKEEAGKMTQAVIEEYLPEDATLNVFDLSENITIERASLKEALGAECVSVSKAASMLTDRLENPDDYDTADALGDPKKVNPFGMVVYAEAEDGTVKEAAGEPAITLVSTSDVIESYKLPVEYVEDDTMLAGDSVIEAEGKTGKREVLRQYTTVNGKTVETKDLRVDILKKAEPKIIRKGTLGLPEGEDWKTYKGDPVFNDGEALIKTALNYLGVPYKLGGKSLVTGVDCFQFIRLIYAKYGINLPHSKKGMDKVGISVSFENAQPGDIIVYPHHYALYMGDNTIVHATSKGGVKVRHNAKFMKIVSIRRIPRS